jgi:hypothetical protein
MDTTKIVVLVLSLIALACLVWVEMKSRKHNRALQNDASGQLTGAQSEQVGKKSNKNG